MIAICENKETSIQVVRGLIHELGRRTQLLSRETGRDREHFSKEILQIVKYLTHTGSSDDTNGLQQTARSVLAGTVSQVVNAHTETSWLVTDQQSAAKFAEFYAIQTTALDDLNSEYKRRVQQALQEYWTRLNHHRMYGLPHELDVILTAESALVATQHYQCIQSFRILSAIPKLYQVARKEAERQQIILLYDDLVWDQWGLLRAQEDRFRAELPEYQEFVEKLRLHETKIKHDQNVIMRLCGDLLYLGHHPAVVTLLHLTAVSMAYYRLHGLGISHWEEVKK